MRHHRAIRWALFSLFFGAVVAAAVAPALPSGREALRKPRASVVAMLSSANVLDLNHAQEARVPGPTKGLVPLRSLLGSIQFSSPRYFAERDAWDRDLLYWSNLRSYAVISTGSDGVPDLPYDVWQAEDFENLRDGRPPWPVPPERDIVLIDYDFVQWPPSTPP